MFEANAESRITDPNKQLLRLVQHCEAEAKKVIDHCLLQCFSIYYSILCRSILIVYRPKIVLSTNFIFIGKSPTTIAFSNKYCKNIIIF